MCVCGGGGGGGGGGGANNGHVVFQTVIFRLGDKTWKTWKAALLLRVSTGS